MVTGSPYHESVGQLDIPGAGEYAIDDSAQIYVLENVAIRGAVMLKFEQFSLHYQSIVTVSKFLTLLVGIR